MDPKTIAEILLRIKAVTLNAKEPYTYASGIRSPIYCDNRLLLSYPEERMKIVEAMMDIIKANNLEFDIIAGVATSGIPHAAWLADKLQKPMIYIRGKAKEHGKGNQIEGRLEQGQKVLVVEDLISTGGSSFNALESAREAGAGCNDLIAIFTYTMEKSKSSAAEKKINVYPLTDFPTLIGVAAEKGYITEEKKAVVLEWSVDPSGWGPKHGFENAAAD
ncbi:orotate phosphoribosyltransferase [Candidatus Woesearchaeota archaeon]|nr:orotate phosphoribosyltransferase [Candidatus Woesearchaeota archaeon]